MRVAKQVWHLLLWICVTVALGTPLLCKLLRRTWGLRIFLSQISVCPRGHRTPIFGVYECRCKAIIEGFVFQSCPVCGSSAGWTPCRKCGLPIRNPFL